MFCFNIRLRDDGENLQGILGTVNRGELINLFYEGLQKTKTLKYNLKIGNSIPKNR